MRFAQVRNNDIANGLGVRCSIFVTGCRLHCPNCFNKELQSFEYGQEWTEKEQETFLKTLEPTWITGASILGGEPMELENQAGVLALVEAIREKFGNTKDIWLYTGYILPVCHPDTGSGLPVPYFGETTDKILSLVDVVVDGPFHEDLKDPSLAFRGSSNQRILKKENGQWVVS